MHSFLSANLTASTLYSYVIDSGSVTMTTGSSGGAFLVKMTGPSTGQFSFGAPLQAPPPGGAVVATVSATTVNAVIFYK